MLLEIDEATERAINETQQYIGRTKFIELNDKKFVSTNDLISIIEDLNAELSRQIEKIEEYDRDIQDNYKPISKAEQYEISDKEFI